MSRSDGIYRMSSQPRSQLSSTDPIINQFYNQESWDAFLNYDSVTYEYRRLGRVIGFISICASKFYTKIDGRETSYPAILIAQLGVTEDSQGQGYGSELIKLAIGIARRIKDQIGCRLVVLDVDQGKEATIRLYKKNGFEIAKTQSKLNDKRLLALHYDLRKHITQN